MPTDVTRAQARAFGQICRLGRACTDTEAMSARRGPLANPRPVTLNGASRGPSHGAREPLCPDHRQWGRRTPPMSRDGSNAMASRRVGRCIRTTPSSRLRTCHLQPAEDAPALCGYQWEGLVRVRRAASFDDIAEALRCPRCINRARERPA
jgi:hypothetical protein